MLRRAALAVLIACGGFAVAVTSAGSRPSHRSGCHAAHTCPSDHHTYVWTDPRTGKNWDCARAGADEYDPSRDTTAITWDGLPYFCRAAGGSSARRRQMAQARAAARVCTRADIAGVAFFDYDHGQTGVAPNAIELHPVVGFRCVAS